MYFAESTPQPKNSTQKHGCTESTNARESVSPQHYPLKAAKSQPSAPKEASKSVSKQCPGRTRSSRVINTSRLSKTSSNQLHSSYGADSSVQNGNNKKCIGSKQKLQKYAPVANPIQKNLPEVPKSQRYTNQSINHDCGKPVQRTTGEVGEPNRQSQKTLSYSTLRPTSCESLGKKKRQLKKKNVDHSPNYIKKNTPEPIVDRHLERIPERNSGKNAYNPLNPETNQVGVSQETQTPRLRAKEISNDMGSFPNSYPEHDREKITTLGNQNEAKQLHKSGNNNLSICSFPTSSSSGITVDISAVPRESDHQIRPKVSLADPVSDPESCSETDDDEVYLVKKELPASNQIEKRNSSASVDSFWNIPALSEKSIQDSTAPPKVTRADSSLNSSLSSEKSVEKVLRVGQELIESLRIARAGETARLAKFAAEIDVKNTSKSKSSKENKIIESKSQAVNSGNHYFSGIYGNHWDVRSSSSSSTPQNRQSNTAPKTVSNQIGKRSSATSVDSLWNIPALLEESIQDSTATHHEAQTKWCDDLRDCSRAVNTAQSFPQNSSRCALLSDLRWTTETPDQKRLKTQTIKTVTESQKTLPKEGNRGSVNRAKEVWYYPIHSLLRNSLAKADLSDDSCEQATFQSTLAERVHQSASQVLLPDYANAFQTTPQSTNYDRKLTPSTSSQIPQRPLILRPNASEQKKIGAKLMDGVPPVDVNCPEAQRYMHYVNSDYPSPISSRMPNKAMNRCPTDTFLDIPKVLRESYHKNNSEITKVRPPKALSTSRSNFDKLAQELLSHTPNQLQQIAWPETTPSRKLESTAKQPLWDENKILRHHLDSELHTPSRRRSAHLVAKSPANGHVLRTQWPAETEGKELQLGKLARQRVVLKSDALASSAMADNQPKQRCCRPPAESHFNIPSLAESNHQRVKDKAPQADVSCAALRSPSTTTEELYRRAHHLLLADYANAIETTRQPTNDDRSLTPSILSRIPQNPSMLRSNASEQTKTEAKPMDGVSLVDAYCHEVQRYMRYVNSDYPSPTSSRMPNKAKNRYPMDTFLDIPRVLHESYHKNKSEITKVGPSQELSTLRYNFDKLIKEWDENKKLRHHFDAEMHTPSSRRSAHPVAKSPANGHVLQTQWPTETKGNAGAVSEDQKFPQNTSSQASPTAMRWATGLPDRNRLKVKNISSITFAENKYRNLKSVSWAN